jgi:hypothetical protein
VTARAIRGICVVALGLAASVLGALFMGPVAAFGAPVVAGVVCAAALQKRGVEIAAGATTGGLGHAAAWYLLTSGTAAALIARAPRAYFRDVPPSLAARMPSVLLDSSSVGSLGSLLLALALGAALGAFGAWVASWFYRTSRLSGGFHVPAALVIVLIVAGMLGAAASSGYRAETIGVAEPESYWHDAAIYRQTHALMTERGMGYYEAFVTAASQDLRLAKEGAVVDGRFRAWATSPSYVRMPTAFYLWAAARGLGLTVYDLAMVVAVVLLCASYWATQRIVGPAAVAVPAILFPYFVTHSVWMNLFFPDYWAALFALGGMLAVLRERWRLAGGLVLAAALFREVAAIWLVFLIVGAAAGWLLDRDRRARCDLAVYVGAFALLALAVALHSRAAASLILPGTVALPIVQTLMTSARRPLALKLGAPAGYLMYPYGLYAVPPAAALLTAPVGYFLSLRRGSRRVLVTLLTAAVFWPVFTATIGAPSTYWGQQYTPLAVLGTTLLVTWGARSASGKQPVPA